MSTAAQPRLAARPISAGHLAPWAIFATDVVALEIAFLLGYSVRLLLASWFTAEIRVEQFLAVAAGILLLPAINYQIGLYPGYLLGPVERLRRRVLATLAMFGGLVAWDSVVARGVLSRGVLLATFLFALVVGWPTMAWLAQLRTGWLLPLVASAIFALVMWVLTKIMLPNGWVGVEQTLIGYAAVLGLVWGCINIAATPAG